MIYFYIGIHFVINVFISQLNRCRNSKTLLLKLHEHNMMNHFKINFVSIYIKISCLSKIMYTSNQQIILSVLA